MSMVCDTVRINAVFPNSFGIESSKGSSGPPAPVQKVMHTIGMNLPASRYAWQASGIKAVENNRFFASLEKLGILKTVSPWGAAGNGGSVNHT